MNGLQFASSLVTSLAWPLVVIVLVIIFRKNVADLIGRIKSYKGLGQELTFGDRLAEAENSVEEAVKTASIGQADLEAADEIEPDPLIQGAEANPSFVVIRSWEQVVSAMEDLAGAGLPRDKVRPRSASSALLRGLQNSRLISAEFANAIRELRDLRNQVAHGQHNPTSGEAIAYAESAQSISVFMRTKAYLLTKF